jgi:Tfp pilus assembly protein PilX
MMKKSCEERTMKEKRLFFGEDGSVLIIALLVLAFFTLLGMSTFSISNMEIRIIGNENIQKQNLYCAEAAAMRCAQDMQDKNLRTESLSYLNGINSATQTQSDIISLDNSILSDTLTELPATTAYASVSRGIASGSSLDMTKTRAHEYSVYGWCNRNNNLVIVEVGYRKAFK